MLHCLLIWYTSAMYEEMTTFINDFCESHDTVDVDGEYYDAPGVTVYKTSSMQLPEKGRIEVNTLSDAAPAMFEWAHEVTIKDKQSSTFIHFLVRPDKSLVETYGKTVLPIDQERGSEILSHLRRLSGVTV